MNQTFLTIFLLLLTLSAHIFPCAAGEAVVQRQYNTDLIRIDSIKGGSGFNYSIISYDGLCSMGDIGMPDLPLDVFKVAVPTYCTDFTVSVTAINRSKEMPLTLPVVPRQEPRSLRDTSSDLVVNIDDMLYTSQHAIKATVLDDGFMMGNIHMVSIALCPFTYDMATKTISIATSVEVRVTYRDCTEDEMQNKPIMSETTSTTLTQAAKSTCQNLTISNEFSRANLASDNDNVSDYYYIIVPENLKNALKSLICWKSQKGYNVCVKTIESICSDSKFRIEETYKFNNSTEVLVDSAASLRAYLHSEFSRVGPFYCFIIGDHRTTMPIRKFQEIKSSYDYYKNFNGDAFIPTDNYFSDLTSTWVIEKPSDIGQYCATSTGSYYPDLVMGRLLCHTEAEIYNYIEKLILYESNPGLGDTSYLEKCVYFEHDGSQLGKCSLIGNSQQVRDVFNPFKETILLQDQLHNTPGGCLPHRGQDVIKAISEVGYISGHGHGSPGSIYTCTWQAHIVSNDTYDKNLLGFTIRDTDKMCGFNNLTNKNKPGVMYSIACDSSPFDIYVEKGTYVSGSKINILDDGHKYNLPYNMGSAYTVADLNGGVAYLGNTRYGYLTSSTYMEKCFGEEILKVKKIGIAETLSKSRGTSYVQKTHHLIGDPEFELWLQRPEVFSITTRIQNLSFVCRSEDTNDIDVKLYNFNQHPINNKRVIVGMTDQVIPLSDCDYVLSFWKSGYLPYMAYYAFQGTAQLSSHHAIVNDAYIGTGQNQYFYISNAGRINLQITNQAHIGRGLRIGQAGLLDLTAGNNCVIEGAEVSNGGILKAKANEIKLMSGFKVFKGGEVHLICE